MRSRSEPEYVLEARRHLTAARKRLYRQSARVNRIETEGRDASAAIKLLKVLQQRERRSAKYLEMVLGWRRAHPGQKFARSLKTRFVNPRAAQRQRKEKLELWDERVRTALDKQFPNAPHYKASIIGLWEKYKSLGLPNAHFFSELHGVSQFPYAVEAVYPAGPIAIPVDRASGAFGTPFVSNRFKVDTAKGKPVPTTLFLDQTNAGVSAIVAFSKDRSDEPLLPLDVVHNHFAKAPIPQGLFGSHVEEFGTEADGKGGIDVMKVATQSRNENANSLTF